ncbi:ATP-binding cassette domain-containing protein [Paenibacillus sp. IHBB 10380]|uniref:ATP-binding cassette domain-containing protein n=1 Tax=Paenibacillus sp. IHBB 10380 TaxID=1566358 RepID=UPI0005CFEAA2|nr:ATP-binding cassette domain-containing protein [Paenibacillus sp. IHBB 10380]AJS59049.1 peptide ABC transporter permease [Paenibacillus sp. IHBB 10380]
MKWSKAVGGTILTVFIAVAIFGPSVTLYGPFALSGERFLTPSKEHWLGTNMLGQDVFSGFVHGARTTLFVGLFVSLLSTFLSGFLGLLSGYLKKLDLILNSFANMLLVLPSLLLILIVASFTGGGIWQLIFTLGLLTWPAYMRLIRASVLSLKEREFVKSAQLFQGNTLYILRKHVLPFIWPLLRTKFVMSFRQAVVMEASLSFIGIGDPNVPSWGKMLQQAFGSGETWMTNVWQWTVLPPVVGILLVTVGLALLGETSDSHKKVVKAARNKIKTDPKPIWTASAAIVCDQLSVTYGDRPIVHPMSFSVAAGSVTVLIGESGSGKTTLAKAIYGLLLEGEVKGDVYIGGKHIYDSVGKERMQRWVDAAYIFQDPRTSFNPLLTIGKQFIEAIPEKQSAHDKKMRAVQGLQEVQLDERVLDCYPHELSGGMLSRALIALALINKPEVLIADEPTGALDPIVKREILELLVAKVREHGMTLLLITHDMLAAKHVANNIMVLQHGKVIDYSINEDWSQSKKDIGINGPSEERIAEEIGC